MGAALVFVRAAHAGNDDELFVGSQAAMTGGAVSAMVSDASATWYNPAGVGAVSLDQIDVSGTFYALRFYAARGFLTSTSGESDPGSVIEFVSVPSQIAYVRRLGAGVSLGLGYFAPQAQNLVLRESLSVPLREPGAEATANDEVTWQLAFNGVRVQHTAAAALGFALSPRVRMGLSAIGTYQNEIQSVSLAGLRTQGGEATAFLGTMQLGTSSLLGVELGAGFQMDLDSAWRLGLSLRSVRLLIYQSLHVLGASGLASRTGDEVSIGGVTLEPRQSTASLAVLRGGRAGLSLARRTSRGDWAALELDVQPGVYNERLGIDRQTVVNARLGGYYRVSETLAVGAGIFSDRSADVPPRDALNARGDFYGATLGFELSDRHRLLDGERDGALSFTSTFAFRYAYSNGTLNDVLVDPADLSTLDGHLGPMIVHELGFYVGGGISY